MLRKILWSIILFFIIYILLIFKAPSIAWVIEKSIWINWFNEFILWFKSAYDETVTHIPSKEELQNTYNTVHSWAIEFKENFDLWVDLTKEKIDAFRDTMSWAEDTLNNFKTWYNETKDFINTNSWVIIDIQNTIETISGITEILINTWETN
jgi:hypothetical protein